MPQAFVKVTVYFTPDVYEAMEEDATRRSMSVSRVIRNLMEEMYSNPRFRWDQSREAWIAMLSQQPIPEPETEPLPSPKPDPIVTKPVAEGVCGCGLAFGYNDGLKHLTLDGEWNPEADADHFVVEAVEPDA